MNTIRLQAIVIRVTMLGVLVAGTAGVAMAQKAKPAGPPITTRGAAKSSPKADKGQATAEKARTEAREEKAERSALESARHEPKSSLKGIKLTDAQKTSAKEIEKKYAEQYKDMEKAEKASDKKGTEDATFASKVDALRTQERAELRALLTPEQQVLFDKNIAPRVAKKS